MPDTPGTVTGPQPQPRPGTDDLGGRGMIGANEPGAKLKTPPGADADEAAASVTNPVAGLQPASLDRSPNMSLAGASGAPAGKLSAGAPALLEVRLRIRSLRLLGLRVQRQ